jgi:hypothetical protein
MHIYDRQQANRIYPASNAVGCLSAMPYLQVYLYSGGILNPDFLLHILTGVLRGFLSLYVNFESGSFDTTEPPLSKPLYIHN